MTFVEFKKGVHKVFPDCIGDFGASDYLVDYDINDMYDIVEIVLYFEKEYECTILESDVETAETFQDLWDGIERAIKRNEMA